MATTRKHPFRVVGDVAGSLQAEYRRLYEKNVIGPVARKAAQSGMRPLHVHLEGYRGASPSEANAIATGQSASKTGRFFDPVVIVDNGDDHDEYGMDKWVIRDGRHRIAAAQMSGASHVAAEIVTPDGDGRVFTHVRVSARKRVNPTPRRTSAEAKKIMRKFMRR